jgi:hypothetical protein
MNTEDPNNRNLREGQAEKLKPSTDNEEIAKFPDTGDAGDRPEKPFGLTEASGETTEEVRTSEGVNPSGAEPPEEAFFDKKVQDSRTL